MNTGYSAMPNYGYPQAIMFGSQPPWGAGPGGAPGMPSWGASQPSWGGTATPMPNMPLDVGGLGGTIMHGVGAIKGWAEKNPQLAADVLGTAASAYGAYKTGQAADKQQALAAQRLKDEEQATQYQQQVDAEERARRRRAYQEILANRKANAGG